jgi:hypothetical protein
MWRSKQTNFVTGKLQSFRYLDANRAFAVCASDVDD